MLYFDYTGGVIISDNTTAEVLVERIVTRSGIVPVVVVTPVVDVVQADQMVIATRPKPQSGSIVIEWRCSNSPFDPHDPAPAWQSHTNPPSARYWQARVTIMDPEVVLDRIEFKRYSAFGATERKEQHLTFNL